MAFTSDDSGHDKIRINPERFDDFKVLFDALSRSYNRSFSSNSFRYKNSSEHEKVISGKKVIVLEPKKNKSYIEDVLGTESEKNVINDDPEDHLITMPSERKEQISEKSPFGKEDSDSKKNTFEKEERIISQKLNRIDLSAITMPPNYKSLNVKSITKDISFGDLFRKKAMLDELENELKSVASDINSLISTSKRKDRKKNAKLSLETKKILSLKDYIKKLKSLIKDRKKSLKKLITKKESYIKKHSKVK